MASVPIVIVGTVKDNDSGEEKSVTITGLASIAGLGVGGGPIIPPDKPPEPPLGIWPGPGDPDLPWWLPHPAHPIVIPPEQPPTEPPPDGEKPPVEGPLFDWKVGWTQESGWIVVAIPKFEHPAPSKK